MVTAKREMWKRSVTRSLNLKITEQVDGVKTATDVIDSVKKDECVEILELWLRLKKWGEGWSRAKCRKTPVNQSVSKPRPNFLVWSGSTFVHVVTKSVSPSVHCLVWSRISSWQLEWFGWFGLLEHAWGLVIRRLRRVGESLSNVWTTGPEDDYVAHRDSYDALKLDLAEQPNGLFSRLWSFLFCEEVKHVSLLEAIITLFSFHCAAEECVERHTQLMQFTLALMSGNTDMSHPVKWDDGSALWCSSCSRFCLSDDWARLHFPVAFLSLVACWGKVVLTTCSTKRDEISKHFKNTAHQAGPSRVA